MAFVASFSYPQLLVKHIIASYFPSLIVDKEDMANLKPLKTFVLDLLVESGYYHIQATKPNTIGKYDIQGHSATDIQRALLG